MSGCSSVETKDKLVEIVWKVFMAYSALVRSQKPTLEKGDRQVNEFTRSIAHAGISAFNDVIVSCRRQSAVSTPAVGSYTTAFHNRCAYKADQALAGGVRHHHHPDPSNPLISLVFDGYSDKRLAFCSATTFAGLFPSNVGFVHFDETTEAITPRADHGPAHLVQPGPRRLIAPESEYPFQAQRAGAVLLTRHPPEGSKPHRQGFVGVLKDRSCDDRYLVTARRTLVQRRTDRVGFHVPTPRTAKALRPPQPCKVVSTRLVARKGRFELAECPGIILHTRPHYM